MIWLILLRPDTVWRCQPLPKAACFDRGVNSRSPPPPHIPLELDLNSIPVALNVLSVYTCDAVHKLNAVVDCAMGSKYYYYYYYNNATLGLL